MTITQPPSRTRGRRSRRLVATVALMSLLGANAAAAAQGVPYNVAAATNIMDGSRSAQTSFAVHQVAVGPDGSLSVVTNPDIGNGRRHQLPASGRRSTTDPGGSGAVAETVAEPSQVQAMAEATVAQILASVVPEGFSGLSLGNAAVAYNSCRDCRATAAAVQVVLISGAPTPPLVTTNVSLAINEDCVECAAGAYAYQLVIVTTEPLRLDRPTLNAIARARQQISHLSHSNHAMHRVMADMQHETDRLEQRLVQRLP